MSLIKACKKGSASAVETEAKKDKVDLESAYTDEKGHEICPLTWCCLNQYLSLVELLVKKGANPNREFINEKNEKISVINWACQQDNGSLVEVLLQNGATASCQTFDIAQKKKAYRTLNALAPQLRSAIIQLYHSKTFQAYDSKMIDFTDGNIYSFAFDTGKANFIAVRRRNKAVIIDAGDLTSELMPNFNVTNEKYEEGKAACDTLTQKIEEFKKNPGKVKKLFTTNSRADPPDSYKRLTNLIRECFKDDVEKIVSIRDKTINDEAEISETIKYYRDKFDANTKVKSNHVLRLLFRDDVVVEAVFITHPHTDHYSLLYDLHKEFKTCFGSTKYYLSGVKEDWTGDVPNRLFKEIGQINIEFIGHEYPSRDFTFLDDIRFKLWGQTKPEDLNDKNQLSLIISMYFKNVKVLFTGDAEGNVLKRLSIDKPTVDESIKVKRDEFNKLVDDVADIIKKGRSQRRKENIRSDIYSKLDNFLKGVNDQKAQKKYHEYIDSMFDIENSFVVYEPHHGSMTEDSHEIYNYLFAQDQKQLFIISSFPGARDFLPKEESVCVNRENKHIKTKIHPIVYATEGNIPSMSMTTDPVFITGSAPDDLYLLKIEEDKVNLLNLDNETPEWETFNQ